ncbi:MAG TPA: hypothetical protein VFI27_05445 [candidate division Zixibacteria bacterium]|nr:hypothetical protein [candidate division Zixibacteria bacterium]
MSPIYDKPVRLLFRDMVDDLRLTKGDVISKQQGIDWFRQNYPKIKSSTVTTLFIKLSTNAPSRPHYHATPDDDLFFQIDGSHYRLYDAETDPPPLYERETSKEKPVVWKMVKEAVEYYGGEAKNADIRDFIHTRYGDVNDSTISCQILICTVNAPSRINWPENHKPRVADDSRYDFLYKIGRGHVVTYEPEKHGIWAIQLNDEGKLEVTQVESANVPLISEPKSQNQPVEVAQKYNWSRLNHLQIGRYAEYFVMMEFTLYGFEVYSTEVDDRGIDFIVRRDGGPIYDVQVKSLRNFGYVFIPKSKFELRPNLLAALVLFFPGKVPDLFLIRATKWEQPDALLVSKDYEGLKSPPEWGVNISRKNLPLLEQYRIDKVISNL